MFNSGNCGIPAVMNVEPTAGGCYNNGMNGFGGDWIWILVVFALLFGWGNNGWGGNGGGNGGAVPYVVGNSYTDASIQRGFDTQAILGKLDGITNGLCDGFYATNTSILNAQNGIQSSLCQGFNGVNTNIMQGNFGLQQAINNAAVANMQGQNALQAQIAQCCCDNRVGQMQIANQMAADTCAITNQANTNTRDIIESNNAGFRAILDKMCQQELAAKDATIAAQNQRIFGLELSASQATQNNVLMAAMDSNKAEILRKTGAECPTAAYIVQPPQPVTFPTNCCGTVNYAGYGNGCGCSGGGCC